MPGLGDSGDLKRYRVLHRSSLFFYSVLAPVFLALVLLQISWNPPADSTVQDMLNEASANVHYMAYYNPNDISDLDLTNSFLHSYAHVTECLEVGREQDEDGDPQTMNTQL